jgi:hypothetical protein
MADSEPFYMPDPDLFAHHDACMLFTRFATGLDEAGLGPRFPAEPKLRHIAIELLAERYAVEDVETDPGLIDGAIVEARGILDSRR